MIGIKKTLAAFAVVSAAAAAFSQTFTNPPSVNPRIGTFIGDADCGIPPLKTYTHKLDFGVAAAMNPAVVNGVAFDTIDFLTPPFDVMEGKGLFPEDLNWSGWLARLSVGYDGGAPVAAHLTLDATNQVYRLLADFVGIAQGWAGWINDIYGNPWFAGPASVTLKGLEPGRMYDVRFYGRQHWCGGSQPDLQITFAAGTPAQSTLMGYKQGYCNVNQWWGGNAEINALHTQEPPTVIVFRYIADSSGEFTWTSTGGSTLCA
ncbi:MAG: hypothetical protein FWG05_05820, partial [Kiritimatiellaeota bacterium]|nr:hypothetical protein [Kiritimatiellota bacterium]